ncbi:MAG: Tyrosine recombinase XerC [Methanonatronarchaeales archaeon]|nr:Tyrosine recombinase XerC [Methanonatronarchaeales archaeon]
MTSSSLDREEREAYYKNRVETQRDRPEREQDRDALQTYIHAKRADAVKWQTLNDSVRAVADLSLWADAALLDLDRRTLQKYVAEVVNEKYAASTASRVKVGIKDFYKHVHPAGDPVGGEYPDAVKHIDTSIKGGNGRRDEEPLRDEEIKAMLEVTDHAQDTAIIAALYDGGFRASEMLSLDIRHVSFERQGAKVRVPEGGISKTGGRTVYLIEAEPYLREHVNRHPDSDNPDAPLFYSRHYDRKGQRMTYNGLRHVTRKLKDRARVEKSTTPHAWRRAAVSKKRREGMSDSAAKMFFGWTRDSEQLKNYDLSDAVDLWDEVAAMHGLTEAEEREPGVLEPWACPRCETRNTKDQRFCGGCGLARTPEAAEELEEAEEKGDEELLDADAALLQEIKELRADVAELKKASRED